MLVKRYSLFLSSVTSLPTQTQPQSRRAYPSRLDLRVLERHSEGKAAVGDKEFDVISMSVGREHKRLSPMSCNLLTRLYWIHNLMSQTDQSKKVVPCDWRGERRERTEHIVKNYPDEMRIMRDRGT